MVSAAGLRPSIPTRSSHWNSTPRGSWNPGDSPSPPISGGLTGWTAAPNQRAERVLWPHSETEPAPMEHPHHPPDGQTPIFGLCGPIHSPVAHLPETHPPHDGWGSCLPEQGHPDTEHPRESMPTGRVCRAAFAACPRPLSALHALFRSPGAADEANYFSPNRGLYHPQRTQPNPSKGDACAIAASAPTALRSA